MSCSASPALRTVFERGGNRVPPKRATESVRETLFDSTESISDMHRFSVPPGSGIAEELFVVMLDGERATQCVPIDRAAPEPLDAAKQVACTYYFSL